VVGSEGRRLERHELKTRAGSKMVVTP
jgi:hypothetical protein